MFRFNVSRLGRRILFFNDTSVQAIESVALENGDVEHATLQGVPNRSVSRISADVFSRRSFARWPLVFFGNRPLLSACLQSTRAASVRLSDEKEPAEIIERRVDIVRASPSSRHLPSGSALSAAPSPPTLPTTPTPTTSLRRCRCGRASASAFFQGASRCAFTVRFSTRRVEALSHAGERRKEATGECVARGVNCEKEKERKKS